MRSSRRESPPFLCGWAKSSSSERSSSRSRSLIAALVLEADERGGAFSHPLLPSVRRADRRESSPLLLELDGPHGKLFGLVWRQARALGGNRRRDLFQAVFAHGFGEDRISLAKRIDPVDQIDVEL